MKGIAFILLALLTSAPAVLSSHAATFYIDSDQGSDSASGLSVSESWKSLANVNSGKFRPGDRILLRRGRTWHDTLVITASGTDETPILIGSYGPESDSKPVICGLYPGPLKWVRIQADIFRAGLPKGSPNPGVLVYQNAPVPPITTLRFSRITGKPSPGAVLLQLDGVYRTMWVTSSWKNTVSGFTLSQFDSSVSVHVRQSDDTGREIQWKHVLPPPETVTDLKALTAPGHWYMAQRALYINSPLPPSQKRIRAGYRKWGIRLINCSHVRVQDISVNGFGEVGVWVHNGNSITLTGLNVERTGCSGHRTGILLFNSENCMVSECRVSQSLGNGMALYAYPGHETGKGTCNNRIADNHVSRSGAAGISLSTDAENTSYLVRGNIIQKNIVEYSNSLAYDAAGIYLLNSGKGNIIRENTIRYGGNSQLRSAGIMLDAGTSATLLEHNTIEANSLAGIAVNGKNHRIVQNIIRNNGGTVWKSAQVVLFPVHVNTSGCVIQHNTLQCGHGQKLLMKTSIPDRPELPHDIDFNTYLSADSRPFCWSSSWACGTWLDFASWKNGTGYDMHSTFNSGRP